MVDGSSNANHELWPLVSSFLGWLVGNLGGLGAVSLLLVC